VSAASAGRERLVQATIVRERPSAIYEVLLGSQHSVLAHLVANEKRNFVRLLPGDKVEVELSPHDPTRGRVVRLIRKATGE
jgi:translation initiation factor IF-1